MARKVANLLFLAKCRLCGHWRDPREFVHDTRIGFCWHCLERHRKAMEVLAGEPPTECPECRATLGELQLRAGGGDIPMRIYVKDGIMQLLCTACGDGYERKQRQMFARTPYGEAKGLD
jgi:hypothetical protein